VGTDVDKDIAVLQLVMPPAQLAQLQPVTLGSSARLMVGQKVYAIGNPFGLDHTLTQVRAPWVALVTAAEAEEVVCVWGGGVLQGHAWSSQW
jgi:S1-C subfamily serine protease